MTSQESEKTISFSEIAHNLNAGITQADPQRDQGMALLRQVRIAKTGALEREKRRLRMKLGASHPLVAAIDGRIQANGVFIQDLDLGIKRAQAQAPQVDAKTWAVHGLVLNDSFQGMPNLTVALFDDKGNRVEAAGSAVTDDNGAYVLRYSPEDPAAAAHKEPTAGPAGKAESQPAGGVHVQVFDNKNARLYADQEVLTPHAGQADYHEVVLTNDGDGGAPQPPGGEGRFLGNPRSGELHDLEKITSRCQIDSIPAAYRIYFKTDKEAINAGYDYCAYCFGKEMSKR